MRPRLEPIDIRHAVEKRGTNLAALARQNGLSNSALNYALKYPAKKAEAVLASFLGLPPEKLWPDRYDPHGNRRVRMSSKRTTTMTRRYREGQ